MGLGTNLNKASNNNFQLVFPMIPGISTVKSSRELSLNIYATVIPSVSIDSADVFWQGGKIHQEMGGINFDNWMVNFTVDSAFNNWKLLARWLFFINNNKDTYSRPTDRYKVDAVLQILNNYRQQIMVIDFKGIWINMLGEVSLTYREGQESLESSANFAYDRFEIREENN